MEPAKKRQCRYVIKTIIPADGTGSSRIRTEQRDYELLGDCHMSFCHKLAMRLAEGCHATKDDH